MTAAGHLVIAALGLALASSGCGEDEGKDGADGRRPPETADRLPRERREAPPAGVAEQVEYFEIGNGGCPSEAAAPRIDFYGSYPRKRVVEIGQVLFQICLVAFAPELPIGVAVRRPDGREVLESVEPQDGSVVRSLLWEPVPGDPIGRHSVTARQGSATATASFEVRRASMRRVRTTQRFVTPGTPARVVLAGFEPRQAVRFHLYRERRQGSGRYSFLASMTARINENGEAVHEIETDPAAPRGNYLLRVAGRVQYGFDLGEEPTR